MAGSHPVRFFAPSLESLEDRIAPAVTASVDVNNVLTVELDAASDQAFITNNGSNQIRVGTTANGTEALGDTGAIVSIVVNDKGPAASQTVNFDGNAFLLNGFGGVGVDVNNIETINLNTDINIGNHFISQNYDGAVFLGADITLNASKIGTVTFNDTIDSASGNVSLTHAGPGSTTINGLVGDTEALSSLTIGGSTVLDSAGVTTTGNQSYGGTVRLDQNTTLNSTGGGSIDFGSTIDSDAGENNSLDVNSTGATSFNGTVGGTDALSLLNIGLGSTILDSAGVTTTGNQNYANPVRLNQNTTLESTGGDSITFSNTIDSEGGENNSLAINTTGATRFAGDVGGTDALSSLTTDAGGTTRFLTASPNVNVTTTGTQTYNDIVILELDTTLTGSTVTFNEDVDGTAAGMESLAIMGNLVLGNGGDDAIGATTSLEFLTVSDTTTFNSTAATDVTTAGLQTYTGAVTLQQDTTLDSTGNGNISFGSTVDGGNVFAANTGGATTFGGLVGGTTALTSVTTNAGSTTAVNGGGVTTTGDQTYNDAVTQSQNAVYTGSNGQFNAGLDAGGTDVTLSFTGTTTLTGSIVNINNLLSDNGGTTVLDTGTLTTAGNQQFDDDAILNENTTLTANAGASTVTFNGNVDSQGGENNSLGITGNLALGNGDGDDVGSVDALSSLTVSGTTAFNSTAAVDVTTTGLQTYTGAVTLQQDTTLDSTGNGDITFGSTIDGGNALAVNTGGNTTFSGAVGGGTALTSVTTNVGGTTVLDTSSITTTGNQQFDDDGILNENTTLTADTVTFNGNVDSQGGQNNSLNITGNLALGNGDGDDVGSVDALSSLMVSGTTTFNSTAVTTVTTTGMQNYNNVALAGNTTLNSGAATTEIAGALTGGGTLTKPNAFTGDLIVSGTGGTNTGTVTISNGNFFVTGELGPGNVELTGNPATLSGNGTIGGEVITDGGVPTTISPTNGLTAGIGTLSTGELDSSAGQFGTYQVDFDGTTNTSDRLNVTGAVDIAGGTLGTNVLGAIDAGDSFVIIDNDGTDAVMGPFNLLPNGTPIVIGGVTFRIFYDGGDGNDVVLTSEVDGTGGDDRLVLRQVAGDPSLLEYNLNSAGFVEVAAGAAFTFNGDGGDDVMVIDFVNGDPTATTDIFFNGEGETNGDVLVVDGQMGGFDATYTPDMATPGDGAIDITGATGTITFTGLEPVDMTGFDSVTLDLPGANDIVNIDNGVDADTGGTPALVFTGSSDTIAFESLHAYGNTTVIVDTTLNTDGDDDININNAGDGNNTNLIINTGANTDTVTVEAGATVNLTGSLSITSPDIELNTANAITTGADQTYTGAVTLGAGTTLTSNGSGNITFSSTVDGGQTLNVDTGGTTTFGGVVGGTTELSSLMTDVGGTTAINGNVATSGLQTYSDGVLIDANAVLSSSGAGNITFNATLDSALGETNSLAINTAGTTTFDGAVGGTDELSSLTTDAGGTTEINGGSVATSGLQTYSDGVLIDANAVLSSSGAGNITFNATLDSALGETNSLAINTGGTTTFDGTVGGTDELSSLTTDAGGTTEINGGSVATSGLQTYSDGVLIDANAVLSSSGAGNITFNATLDSALGETNSLAINTAGTTTFDGAVGGTDELSSLTTDAGGTTEINGGSVATSGLQTYSDGVLIDANAVLSSSGAGNITFNATLDSALGETNSLAINTAGTTTFDGAVGGTDELSSLMTDVGGTTEINGGSVATSGLQTYNDAVTLDAAGNDVILTGTDVTFAETVRSSTDGEDALSVNATGTTTFGGAVGDNAQRLASLTTNAAGTTAINGAFITTTGDQTYNDAVTLDAGINASLLTGVNVTFAQTVRSSTDGEDALLVNATGTTTFGGAVGDNGQRLLGVITDAPGTTAINGGSVNTSGDQNYGDAVTLDAAGNNTTLTAVNVTFGQTLGSTNVGEESLIVNASGITLFGGAVGDNNQDLANLTTDAPGNTFLAGGSVDVHAVQTYNDPVTLDAATNTTSLTGIEVIFGQTLRSGTDGEEALFIRGLFLSQFGGAVGDNNQRLLSLTTDAIGTTQIDGGTVETTTTQTYNSVLRLGGNTTLTGTDLAINAGVQGAFNLTLTPSGTATFTGVRPSTHTGTTTLTSGTTLVNGTFDNSGGTVTVQNGATLGGRGTIDRNVVVEPGATLAPGISPGILTAGDTTLGANADFAVEINGTTAGTEFDQLVVTGTVNVTGANLDIALGFTPAMDAAFTIVDNDLAEPVVGTFAGLAEGAVFTVGGTTFRITYQGGDGNDVVLSSDITAPTVAIQGAPTSVASTVAFPVTFEFSEDVTGFTLADIVIGNGTASNLVMVDGNTYTADITPSGTGDVTINVPAGAAQDAGGNPSTAAAQETVEFRVTLFAVGADAGGTPRVIVYNSDGSVRFDFFAYDPAFGGGVHVTTADFNGDGLDDIITGAGAGGGPHVRIFNGADLSLINEFFAYDASFAGGVFVAAGDVNGDGFADIITGAGAGGTSHVRVFGAQGEGILGEFFAYDPSFSGGVTVAVGDVDGDGNADVITGAGAGGSPLVRVVDALSLNLRDGSGVIQEAALLGQFFAYDPGFLGGAFVAARDVNGDGRAEILTGAGAGGGPHVKLIEGTQLNNLQPNGVISNAAVLAQFFAYEPPFAPPEFVPTPTFGGGVRVGLTDFNADGTVDIVTGAGPVAALPVQVLDSGTLEERDSFFAFGEFGGGLFVS